MPIKKTKGGSGIPRAASSASPIESVSPKGVQDLIGSLMGGKRKRVGGTRKRVGGTRKRARSGMYATRQAVRMSAPRPIMRQDSAAMFWWKAQVQ